MSAGSDATSAGGPLFEVIPVPLVVATGDGSWVRCNEAARRTFGWSPDVGPAACVGADAASQLRQLIGTAAAGSRRTTATERLHWHAPGDIGSGEPTMRSCDVTVSVLPAADGVNLFLLTCIPGSSCIASGGSLATQDGCCAHRASPPQCDGAPLPVVGDHHDHYDSAEPGTVTAVVGGQTWESRDAVEERRWVLERLPLAFVADMHTLWEWDLRTDTVRHCLRTAVCMSVVYALIVCTRPSHADCLLGSGTMRTAGCNNWI